MLSKSLSSSSLLSSLSCLTLGRCMRFALPAPLSTFIVPVLGLTLALPAAASQVEVKIVDSYRALAAGTFEDAALTPDGAVRLGRQTTPVAKELTGPVLDMVEHRGEVYLAVATPPRVMRVRPGKAAELVAAVDTGLITSLASFGPHLVAITAPEGGAVLIDAKRKKIVETIKFEKAKMLLDVAVLDDTLYAVGGGDEGILASLKRGKKAFEVVVKTKEAHLRSLTADPKRNHLWIGGGDDGVIYRYDPKAKTKEGRLLALYDAAPEETTSLTIDSKGRVYATLVDSNGKLSAGATKRDKSEEATKSGETKPRKIKSSEVVRIDPTGAISILWQSKVDGAFSAALVDDKRLLVGSGPSGKIFDIDPTGKNGAAVVARAKGADEVTAMLVSKGRILAATAHPGGVVEVQSSQAKRGVFTTAPLAASTLARWGRLSVDHTAPAGTSVRWSIRTGNTNDPDQTWTPFSPPLIHAGNPIVDPGKYMQVRVELMGNGKESPIVRSIRAAYLEDNRPPEIDRIDLVLPNYKVMPTQKDAKSTNRSVTFNDGAFKKYLYSGGSPLPKLTERPGGKQTEEPGWRTAFAWVEDPDKDQLRYQWSMARVRPSGEPETFVVVKEWSEEPFYSFDGDRMQAGTYRLKVDVSDVLSNGPDRARTDSMVSSDITVTKDAPVISGGSARRLKGEAVRIRFSAKAAVPLKLAECSVGGADFIPIDSLDGMVDGEEERFEVVLDGKPAFNAVACAVTDELGHRTVAPLSLR